MRKKLAGWLQKAALRLAEEVRPKAPNERSATLDRSRSASLPPAPRHYVLVDDEAAIDDLFQRLKSECWEWTRSKAQRSLGAVSTLRFEAGVLEGRRPYFFLQPWNESGWLFERSPRGWIIAQADKIVGQDTFLRAGDTWDAVAVFRPDGAEGLLRLSSKRSGDNLVSFPVYESQLRETLPLGSRVGESRRSTREGLTFEA